MKLFKLMLGFFVLVGATTALIISQTNITTLFYCCSPKGLCQGKGFEDMGTCQQACAGGDLGYRCQARATEVAAPAALVAPVAPGVAGPGVPTVSPMTGTVEGISEDALPIIEGEPE